MAHKCRSGASRTRTQNIADDGYQGDPIDGSACSMPRLKASHNTPPLEHRPAPPEHRSRTRRTDDEPSSDPCRSVRRGPTGLVFGGIPAAGRRPRRGMLLVDKNRGLGGAAGNVGGGASPSLRGLSVWATSWRVPTALGDRAGRGRPPGARKRVANSRDRPAVRGTEPYPEGSTDGPPGRA
jgi:hypothetical protein